MWERAVSDALPEMRRALKPGSRVLEIGYGDGLLSCYLCQELGCSWTGLDIRDEAERQATDNAARYGLSDRMKFHVCRPEATREQTGQYDAVFIKTVLYSSATLEEYAIWLDWIASVLKLGGCLINFETGRANAFTQLYRRMRGRSYTGLKLYTGKEERLYDERFTIVYRRYYGGISQFFAPLPAMYPLSAAAEERLRPGNADNCFIVAMIGVPKDRF